MTDSRTNRGTRSSDSSVPGGLGRREWLAYSAAFGAAFLGRQGLGAEAEDHPSEGSVAESPTPPRRYDMKKSINLWAFPYPDKMSLEDCFRLAKDAGFDGVEINFALDGEFSAESTPDELRGVGRLAEKVGIAISGVCSFLFWPYSMTHEDPERREQGLQLARQMIQAANLVGTEDLLIVPGAVYVPWLDDVPPVPSDVCHQRARQAIEHLLPLATKAGVYLNIENIFANGFLFSPEEMVNFVDQFDDPHVQVHFDTGNIMQYQFPEHWIPILGKRIKNIHFKEWDQRTQEFTLHTFRTLLDGTTNWPAVIEALDKIGYRGYLTFEYFHPFQHFPDALVYQTSDALDRMLGRK
ncbi:MAG: sugar phosphate isomerase/epimerase [Planctomycetaceae bacterium]|nr:MAG: sugar phosphate isomerase/epimerase [Planctomycetaceae bacterium]